MATIHEIQPLIKELCTKDRLTLIAWLEEYEADEWDSLIERDVQAGKHDELVAEARREFDEGLTDAL